MAEEKPGGDELDLHAFHSSHTIDIYRGSYGVPFERADLEEIAAEYSAAIDFAFNPPDGDGSQENLLIQAMLAAAEWIQQQPCLCTAAMVEDWDPCGRCRVLGRLADKRLDQ